MGKYQILFVIVTLMLVGTKSVNAQQDDRYAVQPSNPKPAVKMSKNKSCLAKCEQDIWGGPCQFVKWKIISVSKAICENEYNKCLENCK